MRGGRRPSAADRARAGRLAAAGPPSEMVGLETFVPGNLMLPTHVAVSGGTAP